LVFLLQAWRWLAVSPCAIPPNSDKRISIDHFQNKPDMVCHQLSYISSEESESDDMQRLWFPVNEAQNTYVSKLYRKYIWMFHKVSRTLSKNTRGISTEMLPAACLVTVLTGNAFNFLRQDCVLSCFRSTKQILNFYLMKMLCMY
jgi:hypothetical protein